MKRTASHWATPLRQRYRRFALAPRRVLFAVTSATLALALLLVGSGLALLYRPSASAMAATLPVAAGPLMPADFTPVASPPPAFVEQAATSQGESEAVTPAGAEVATVTVPALAARPTVAATATPFPLDAILREEAEGNTLQERRWLSLLLMGTDARPDEGVASRTDTMMVVILDLAASNVLVISIPRDLWVYIPAYGQARINSAYFLGQLYGSGPELAQQTVSELLGIPITHTMTIDFGGFRRLVDEIGGIDLNVPTPIDDELFPDDAYGTFHLQIPAGRQRMDGERALQYARTRHGSSDLERAERQQAVLQAIRTSLLQPEQLPHLPGYLLQGASEVDTTLSLPDLFFLARFLRTLERDEIFMHVIEPPLLWNGVTADGQQVLLYDPYSLQQAVQEWVWEAARSHTRQNNAAHDES